MSTFDIQSHAFTSCILEILKDHFGDYASDIFTSISVLGYLNNKTKAANRGSKARGAFANHYALYVVVEDYINKGFVDGSAGIPYSKYEGARFSDLFKRQRELPFGAKLQNHALYDLSGSEGCWFDIDNGTCALCRLTYTNCTSCPIFKSSGDDCINVFEIWLDFQNPEPMINLLKQTLSWYLCEYNKGEIYEDV